MQILLEFLKATLGLTAVLSAWFGVQALVRRASKKSAHEDVLEFLAHGNCGGCENRDQCATKKERKHQHELA